MLTHLDNIPSLLLDPISCRWSLLLSVVDCPSASPFANCLLWVPFSNSSDWCSFVHFRSRRDLELRPLFGFAPKQAKRSSAWRTPFIVSHRYEHFITFLTFRLSTRGERDTIFTMMTVRAASALNERACIPLQTPGLASPRFESQLALSTLKSQLTAFFKIPKNPSPSLPGMASFTSPVLFLPGFFIMTSVIVTFSRASMNTYTQCLHITNPNDKI